MERKIYLYIVALSLVLSATNHPASAAATKAQPAPPAAAEAAKDADAAPDWTAVVLEVKPGGNYTYLRVKNGGKEKWAAIPKNTTVKVGQQIEFLPGEVMTNFNSKTLGRTFDRILFSEGLVQKK